MLQAIESDLAILHTVARWVERISADGKRLKPREVVAEFDIYLHDELDLIREAANAAQLRRNMASLDLMHGARDAVGLLHLARDGDGAHVRRADQPGRQRLRDAGVDIPKLARDGVTIFFTQVFRDGFFHADMHPGNIQVSIAPDTFGRYIALDFGIIGTLTESDKDYLAQNFIAFFRRDYKRVAELHIESGWVPADTRLEELESAVRAVCEPHFDRPLKDISLGQVLLRLFQTSRRFNVEIQPQLVLLQKTLLNVEGLGRQLDPELDLWSTAQALPRALDEPADRLARLRRPPEGRGAALRALHPGAAAPGAPGAVDRRAQDRGRAGAGLGRAGGRAAEGAAAHQPAAAGDAVGGGGLRRRAVRRPAGARFPLTTLIARRLRCERIQRLALAGGSIACARVDSSRKARIFGARGPSGRGFRPRRPAPSIISCLVESPAMPIYAYRCASCGHSRDVLQKISDPVLTTCPACGADQFQKQVTAAGFQLKGSGWYATDFKGGSATAPGRRAGHGRRRRRRAAAAPAPAPSSDGGSAASASSSSSSGSHGGGSCACH